MRKRIRLKIVCYNCKKTKGVAYCTLPLLKNGKQSHDKKLYGWEAKGFKHIGDEWLCDKCDTTRRCKRCKILLSNLWKCNCGKMHTAYYKRHPEFCKKCWDKYQNRTTE